MEGRRKPFSGMDGYKRQETHLDTFPRPSPSTLLGPTVSGFHRMLLFPPSASVGGFCSPWQTEGAPGRDLRSKDHYGRGLWDGAEQGADVFPENVNWGPMEATQPPLPGLLSSLGLPYLTVTRLQTLGSLPKGP